jgi:hypothetical protein
MCDRIELVTGMTWPAALTRTPHSSEYLLYGTFVDRVLDDRNAVWVDESDRCLTYWDMTPLQTDQADVLIEQFADGDLAVLVSSHSHTDETVLRHVRNRLTGGRLK